MITEFLLSLLIDSSPPAVAPPPVKCVEFQAETDRLRRSYWLTQAAGRSAAESGNTAAADEAMRKQTSLGQLVRQRREIERRYCITKEVQ